jgi:hypothetical protein
VVVQGPRVHAREPAIALASVRGRRRASEKGSGFVLTAALLVWAPASAETFAARIAWLPSPNPAVLDYRVYHEVGGQAVRRAEATLDAGRPPPRDDGTLVFDVADLDERADHRFVVTAVTPDGSESAASNGLVLLGGGTCSVPAGSEGRDALHVVHFAIRRVAREPLLVARASLPIRGARLTAGGARLAVQGPDGAILYRASIPAAAFRHRGARKVYRDGLHTVVVHRGRRRAWVRLRAVAPAVIAAPRGLLTWVVGLGRACARNRHVLIRARS